MAQRLGLVAAAYGLYLAFYFVLGEAAFTAGRYFWHEVLVIAATGLAMLRSGLHGRPPARGFLFVAAIALLPLAASDASYGRDVPLWRDAQGAVLQLTDASYATFLFAWVCAWAGLALAMARRRRPGARTVAVFTLLMFGFVALFAGFYGPLYARTLGTLAGRVGAATALLELLAVVAGMAVMLLGAGHALVLQVFGVTLLAASDMLYSGATAWHQDFATADPVWMLGLCLLLAGALLLSREPWAHHAHHRHRDASGPAAGDRHRSGLSTTLLALSLGAVLVSALVSLGLRQGTPGVGEPFFFVLFVVTLVAVMVGLTERFDRAVAQAGQHAVQLLDGGLRDTDWRSRGRPPGWILEATGLGHLLDGLHAAAVRLRREVLFLGPERLNPSPQQAEPGAPTCFIVMPFGQADSDAVHQVLREACQQAGLRPLRGDDLFTPTDILDDIWRGITGAHCVIADITGRNPNVMYELGMAHTLAKPVIILSRDAGDIPIDLSTRRVILYGTGQGADWKAVLAGRVQAALQALLQQFPAGRT